MPRHSPSYPLAAKVGRQFGKLCARCEIKDQAHFDITAAQAGHPLRELLQFALSLESE
jgi:hypothetical protein